MYIHFLCFEQLDKVTELKFRMIDFQCNILKSTKNFKAAKNLMKSCIVEAIECVNCFFFFLVIYI